MSAPYYTQIVEHVEAHFVFKMCAVFPSYAYGV
jgi:hypothetical protein